jgi:hypothetical protein
MMIRLVSIRPAGASALDLGFSDGAAGRWAAEPLIARDTDLTRPLADPAYFRRAFIEAGALCWPNGLELSAPALHRKLDEAGKLSRDAA